MKVICAGFPKTGTKSMANALRTLGYSVHDFEEHLEYNLENYVDYLEGRVGEEVFLEMYREVDAVVDMPACTLSMVIHKQFPEAKVILILMVMMIMIMVIQGDPDGEVRQRGLAQVLHRHDGGVLHKTHADVLQHPALAQQDTQLTE